jgi:hypothetical protein
VSPVCGFHRTSTRHLQRAAVSNSCSDETTPNSAGSFSGKRRSHCANADDDPSLVIQDPDLLSLLAVQLSHAENPSPNAFKVGGRMTLAK